jgi:hypothetical protein
VVTVRSPFILFNSVYYNLGYGYIYDLCRYVYVYTLLPKISLIAPRSARSEALSFPSFWPSLRLPAHSRIPGAAEVEASNRIESNRGGMEGVTTRPDQTEPTREKMPS